MVKQKSKDKSQHELDANLAALQQVESIAEQGAQKVIEIIENEFKKMRYARCDVYDLFYFGCYFLTILLLRFSLPDRQRYALAVYDLLKEQAEQGESLLSKVIAASKERSPVRETQLLEELSVEMDEDTESIKQIMGEVASGIGSMAVYEDGVWQRGEEMLARKKNQKQMETLLLHPFDELIDSVIADMYRKCESVPDPYFILLIITSVNVGLMAGCGAKTYHQPISDFMQSGLEKLTPLIHGEVFASTALH